MIEALITVHIPIIYSSYLPQLHNLELSAEMRSVVCLRRQLISFTVLRSNAEISAFHMSIYDGGLIPALTLGHNTLKAAP